MAATKRPPLTRKQRQAIERQLHREYDPRSLPLRDEPQRISRNDEDMITREVREREDEAKANMEDTHAARADALLADLIQWREELRITHALTHQRRAEIAHTRRALTNLRGRFTTPSQ
jgi:hypothetical protein